ncbi:MAG: hypothetical protein JO180_00540 [Gemmatirosa sp.]|nr:hypothetical protein [Gemmatirosa sp.]
MFVRSALLAAMVLAAGGRDVARAGRPPVVRQPKRVALRIHPRVGDTLRMRFEQRVQAGGPERTGEAAVTRASAIRVLSRSIVQRVDAGGATVLTITDSAAFEAPGADPRAVEAARRALTGRRTRMHVSPAGAMEILDQPSASDAAAPFAHLPGTLPDAPVAVGATWTREMLLPWGGVAALAETGKLEVEFRLDSLEGGVAYVSMHGALSRTGVAAGGARVVTSGTMTGGLQVDLRRGRMTDSRATFAMVSTLTPPPGSVSAKASQVRLTVTQRLHCTE